VSRRKRYTRNLGRVPAEAIPKRGNGATYVRFAHDVEPYGVFSYVSDARRRLSERDRGELDDLLAWFRAHLDEPTRLVPVLRQRRTGSSDPEPSALCWFRASAREHLERARRLTVLVRRAGLPIVERWSEDVPGQVCSEDVEQVAVASFWSE
jgi:hypothetical protein